MYIPNKQSNEVRYESVQSRCLQVTWYCKSSQALFQHTKTESLVHEVRWFDRACVTHNLRNAMLHLSKRSVYRKGYFARHRQDCNLPWTSLAERGCLFTLSLLLVGLKATLLFFGYWQGYLIDLLARYFRICLLANSHKIIKLFISGLICNQLLTAN